MADIAYRTADVDGLTVFYREAGTPDAATLVLLHGNGGKRHRGPAGEHGVQAASTSGELAS
jgi:pimeloyl-ACP methyl ester carboxylesterase